MHPDHLFLVRTTGSLEGRYTSIYVAAADYQEAVNKVRALLKRKKLNLLKILGVEPISDFLL